MALTEITKFVIHFSALRKTMLKAHRRAWLWQDEWYGLTMDDIREIERQTQEILRKKMALAMGASSVESVMPAGKESPQQKKQQQTNDNRNSTTIVVTLGSIEKPEYESTTATRRTNTSNRLRVYNLKI